MPLAADHPGAINIPREPLRLRPASEWISEGVAISVYYGMKVTPVDVARVLTNAMCPYVLAGTHAINAHSGRPRATRDVDVLTTVPEVAADALLSAFPFLSRQVMPAGVRLMLDDQEAVDLIDAASMPLFVAVDGHTTDILIYDQLVRVPCRHGAAVMKFASWTRPTREQADRFQDVADFMRVFVAADELDLSIDLDLLRELGELVYAGGGDEITRHAADVRAGRPLQI